MDLYPLRDKPLYKYTREELLEEVASAADDAYLTARHAAAFLNTTEQTLANWRQQKHGPKFNRIDRFIRYRLGDLKDFIRSNPLLRAMTLVGFMSRRSMVVPKSTSAYFWTWTDDLS